MNQNETNQMKSHWQPYNPETTVSMLVCCRLACIYVYTVPHGPGIPQRWGHLAVQYATLWEFGLAVFNLSVFLPGVPRWLSGMNPPGSSAGWVWSLVQKTSHAAERLSPRVTTTEPVLWAGNRNCWAHLPKLLTPGPPWSLCARRSHALEKSRHYN